MHSLNYSENSSVEKIIDSHCVHLISEIQNPEIKSVVSDFFYNDCFQYFSTFMQLQQSLQGDTISRDSATEIMIDKTNEILHKGRELQEYLENNHYTHLVSSIKKIFRKIGVHWGAESKLLAHAFFKPRGYAGDYIIIENIYNNISSSKDLGFCIDQTFLRDDYAKAVRSRMEKMKHLLNDFISNSGVNLNIINIACGSSREIRHLLEERSLPDTKEITFNLIDHDQEALAFSKENIEQHLYGSITCRYIQQNVYDYIYSPDEHTEMFRSSDLVYSIGLADYLSDDALKKFISFTYRLLKNNGTLIIAHKDSKNYNPLSADWWCDWTFNLRNENEVVALIKDSGIENYELAIERETNTNIILFLRITKK